jgi:uncharacterized protein involved in cysteine biosynthesis
MAGPLLMKLLAWLGFTAVTFVGTDALISTVISRISDLASGLPSVAFQVLGLLKLDLAFSLILSAYAFRIARTFGASGVRRLMSGLVRR